MLPSRRGTSGGEIRAEDLAVNLDDLSRDEVHLDLGPRRHNLRPRFPQCQAGADARTGAVDDSIRDTHL